MKRNMKTKTRKAVINVKVCRESTFEYWNKFWKLKDRNQILKVHKECSYNGEHHCLVSEIDNPKNKRHIPSIYLRDID